MLRTPQDAANFTSVTASCIILLWRAVCYSALLQVLLKRDLSDTSLPFPVVSFSRAIHIHNYLGAGVGINKHNVFASRNLT